MPDYYEVKIRGHLDPHWSDWFAGLKVSHLEGDETLLSGPLPDQAALHGLLERIRDLNLTLISVTCGGPSTQHSNVEPGLCSVRHDEGGVIMAKDMLTDKFSEPLKGVTTAKVDINAGDGNLTIDRLTGDEQVLASGALQYFENQGLPTRTLVSRDDQATLTLRGGSIRRPWFRFPWAACNGASEWQIHLNPTVSSDIAAHSDGGNVKLNLAGMAVSRVSADTGGGNMDVVLPDNAINLSVTAKTGAGNVTVEIGSGITGGNTVNANSGAGNVSVHVPSSIAAKVHATSGLGKVIVDPRFSKTNKNTYQSPDYDGAANKVEITVHSGAGNVSVNTQ